MKKRKIRKHKEASKRIIKWQVKAPRCLGGDVGNYERSSVTTNLFVAVFGKMQLARKEQASIEE